MVLTLFFAGDKAALNILYNGLFLLINNLSRIKSQERYYGVIGFEHFGIHLMLLFFSDELYQFVQPFQILIPFQLLR